MNNLFYSKGLQESDSPRAETAETAKTPIRLVLTPEQTAEIVAQAGGENHHGRVFVTASPGSYPTAPGKLVLHFVECPSIATASAACETALGQRKAGRRVSD